MAERSGWFCLWRELFDKPIWANSTNDQRSVFITILYLAAWKEREWDVGGEKFTIHPGEVFISTNDLAKKSGVTRQVLRTALERFVKMGFILTKQITNRGTLITVVNWGKYQVEGREDNQPDNQPVTNHQPTGNQPLKEQCNQVTSNTTPPSNAGARANKYKGANANSTVTTVERVESQDGPCTNLTDKTGTQVESSVEGKKPRKNFVEPTVEEVESYITERGYHFSAELFCGYYASQGWRKANGQKLSDWRQACVTWESREKERNGKRKNGFSQHSRETPRENRFARQTGRGQSPGAWDGITGDNYFHS